MIRLRSSRLSVWVFNAMLLAHSACAGHKTETRLAKEVYRNLTVLQELSAREVEPTMQAFNRALDVKCAHCHVPEQWHDESKPAFAIARNMMRMVQTLNENHLPKGKSVSCWTCHGGQIKPERMPREKFELILESWPKELAEVEEGTQLGMAVFSASLGVRCEYCHVTNNWKASARPAHQMVSVMNGMFEIFPKFMPPGARTQCWMCHKGSTTPAR